MKTRKEIIEWIVSQSWCDKFIANVTTSKQRYITTDKKVLLDIVIPSDCSVKRIIDRAFYWGLTKEGRRYWDYINKEYQSFLVGQEEDETEENIDLSLCSDVNAKKIKNYIKYLLTAEYCNDKFDRDEDGLMFGIENRWGMGFTVGMTYKPLAVFNSTESAQMGIRLLGDEFLKDFILFP